jgi:hypothetical protein
MARPLKLSKSDTKKIADNLYRAGAKTPAIDWPLQSSGKGKGKELKGNPKAEAIRRQTEGKPQKVTIRIRPVTSYIVEEFLTMSNASCYGPVATSDSKVNARRIAKMCKRKHEKDNVPVTYEDKSEG